VALEGFWTVQFQTMASQGTGVVTLIDGKIFGGDAGYTYLGTYEENQDKVKARLEVRRYEDSVVSVFGTLVNFSLELNGRLVSKTSVVGNASTPSLPATSLRFEMKWVTSLSSLSQARANIPEGADAL